VNSVEIDSYKYWMDKLKQKSPGTKRTYKYIFAEFLRYTGKTANELIALKQKSNGDNRDPRENAVVEDIVLNWLSEGLKGKSSSTRRTSLAVIMSFFNCNKHPLNLDKNDYESADSIGSETPSKQQILQIADSTTGWKYRAAVFVLKDSGIRCSDLRKLTWEDKQDLGDGFWHWTIITQKRKVKAQVFVGPETTRLLSKFKTKKGRIFPTSKAVMNFGLNRAIRKAGVKRVTAHGLRKFHTRSLQHGRVPDGYILAMEGKRHSVYSEDRPEELFEAYKNAYDELSLYVGKNGNQRIEELQQELTQLRWAYEAEVADRTNWQREKESLKRQAKEANTMLTEARKILAETKKLAQKN
jgi:integrase